MKKETEERLLPKYEKVIGLFSAMSGADSYEASIRMLQEECRNGSTSPAAWLHKRAREIYPTDQPDSVRPEFFFEILTMIDSREKAMAVFAALPEEEAPKIEEFLDFFLKEFAPSLRSNAKLLAKKLPQRRSGGPHSKMPSREVCRAICDEIQALERKGVQRGIAQRRVADKRGLKLRMVQRIWAARAGFYGEEVIF
jgi:hypothetical protein